MIFSSWNFKPLFMTHLGYIKWYYFHRKGAGCHLKFKVKASVKSGEIPLRANSKTIELDSSPRELGTNSNTDIWIFESEQPHRCCGSRQRVKGLKSSNSSWQEDGGTRREESQRTRLKKYIRKRERRSKYRLWLWTNRKKVRLICTNYHKNEMKAATVEERAKQLEKGKK